MTEVEKNNRLKVKRAFYNYKANRAAYLSKINDICNGSANSSDRVKSSNLGDLSDKIIKADCAEYRWCVVVERTLKDFAESGRDKFIADKFFNGFGDGKLCAKYCISYQTVRNWTDDVVTYGVYVALSLGLIKF